MKEEKDSQLVGFEPTLPKGIWFLVRRLNRSATTAYGDKKIINIYSVNVIQKIWKTNYLTFGIIGH